MTCQHCATNAGKVDFDCVGCAVRWLMQMSREEMELNAPVIGLIKGNDHVEKVREAYRIVLNDKRLMRKNNGQKIK